MLRGVIRVEHPMKDLRLEENWTLYAVVPSHFFARHNEQCKKHCKDSDCKSVQLLDAAHEVRELFHLRETETGDKRCNVWLESFP